MKVFQAKPLRKWLLVLVGGVALGACAQDEVSPGNPPLTGGSGEPAVDASEQCPANVEPFAIGASGLAKTDPATGLTVRLVDASASPPALDYNDWTIAITDAAGAPVQAAQITWACAWMAVHGHGSNPRQVKKLDAGRFELVKQNLAMYGPWQVRLWIDPTGASDAYVPQSGGGGIVGGEICTPSNGAPFAPTVVFDVCVPRSRAGN
jgi:hypothetical protein